MQVLFSMSYGFAPYTLDEMSVTARLALNEAGNFCKRLNNRYNKGPRLLAGPFIVSKQAELFRIRLPAVRGERLVPYAVGELG